MENPKTIQLGNYYPKPTNTGRNWRVTGDMIYNLEADLTCACVRCFGIDTEGGDRAKLNLLRKPIELIITLADDTIVCSSEEACEPRFENNEILYEFSPHMSHVKIKWGIWFKGENLIMSLETHAKITSGYNHDKEILCPGIKDISLIFPFSPRAMGTNILSNSWGEKGNLASPLIINALDMGQLSVNSHDGISLKCRFIGSRAMKRIDFYIGVAESGAEKCYTEIHFSPARLERPSQDIPNDEWLKARRGLLSLLQCTPYYPFANGFCGSPGGIIGNNVISDPVSCNMRHNLRWVAGMGTKTKVGGVDLNQIARYTIEYWLQNRLNPDGAMDYVLEKGNTGADGNTGVLNAAGDYFNSTGDIEFVFQNKKEILHAVNYFVTRDLCDDGLFISVRDGNGGNSFGDTGYDTISSGYKNAMINAQAYKAYCDVSVMMCAVGDNERADFYHIRALKLRKSFNMQFFDANTGLYYWWIGKNGVKHQYIFPALQETAVFYGLAEHIREDTGFAADEKTVMRALWKEFGKAGYYDSQKDKYVKYISPEREDFTGFYWGIPTNLIDVPDEYNYSNYGEFEFPYYCNGGIFPQDTTFAIEAFYYAGMEKEASIIKEQIYKRQHQGIFENGSGFYMGVVNVHGMCYSIIKWDGTPTDYEGIISRDCSFLENTLWYDKTAYGRLVATVKNI